MILGVRNSEATTEDTVDVAKAELQEELKENLDDHQESEVATEKRSKHGV